MVSDLLTEKRAEMVEVSCSSMGGACGYRGEQGRWLFGGKRKAWGNCATFGHKQLQRSDCGASDSDTPYSPSTGVQDLSGLKRSIWINSFRVAGPKSFW